MVGASHGSEEPYVCPTMLETEKNTGFRRNDQERERETPELSLYFRVKVTFEEDKEITSVILSIFFFSENRDLSNCLE